MKTSQMAPVARGMIKRGVIKLAASGLVAFDPADTLSYTFVET
ncbi:MAG: hypothetical protein ACJA1E_001017 [Paracoccaceae bacterium]|jgi:hypothetical protein